MLMRETIGAKPAVASPQRAAAKVVHLREEKVFVQLGAKEERDAKVWICDTEAMNHMSVSWVAFTNLDLTVCGTVRFGDDSVVEMEGCGLALFRCKNGEHREFAGVYYIPHVMTNTVSMGQLDEAGYDIYIKEGTMSVNERSGRLLTRLRHIGNRLFAWPPTVRRAAGDGTPGSGMSTCWH
jgi:hypothetical protein